MVLVKGRGEAVSAVRPRLACGGPAGGGWGFGAEIAVCYAAFKRATKGSARARFVCSNDYVFSSKHLEGNIFEGKTFRVGRGDYFSARSFTKSLLVGKQDFSYECTRTLGKQ